MGVVYGVLKYSTITIYTIGGIKGGGFKTKEDMMSSALPMWKLVRKNGKIVSVAIYKDKKGRKFVAGGTDGSKEGKAGLIEILKSDLSQSRSYTELSGPIFHVLKKALGSDGIKPFLLTRDEFATVSGEDISIPSSNDDELKRHPEFADYFYSRELGGHKHTKIALGTPGKKIRNL